MIERNSQTALKSPKRCQIVEAAFKLFKARGFYATGVDLIMQTANVSKRTLYKYFPTKNDLIVAVLDYYRTTYADYLDLILNQKDKTRDIMVDNVIFKDYIYCLTAELAPRDLSMISRHTILEN